MLTTSVAAEMSCTSRSTSLPLDDSTAAIDTGI
jgi:hypothetical protein